MRRSLSAPASEACAWRALQLAYQAAWSRRHAPLGLLLHPAAPGFLACVRGGAMLGLLRTASSVEALAVPPGAAAAELAAAALPPNLRAVHACVGEAGALLGPLVQEAFLGLLVTGARGLAWVRAHARPGVGLIAAPAARVPSDVQCLKPNVLRPTLCGAALRRASPRPLRRGPL
jgi:hypothetical protein